MTMNQPIAFQRPRRPRAGATLVELMITCVILMVMAIGGAAYLTQSRTSLGLQRNKRVALEAGNARLEAIRATPYTALTGLFATDYTLHYLSTVGGTWQISSADPGETVNINGALLPLTTTVRYRDVDGGTNSYDGLGIVVSAAYRSDSSDRVTLQSLYAP